ncbi:hypothetical protein [uncultured Nostoc sp.]|uniref:hypothetical protein n=1 Tax=uncultured Nostoc sp. TaxID=340711 RepID=UPI0035C97E68
MSDKKPLLDESVHQHVYADVKQPYNLISGLGTIPHPVSTSKGLPVKKNIPL